MPRSVAFRLSEDRDGRGVAVAVRTGEKQDRERLPLQIFPNDGGDLAADELRIMPTLDGCRRAHAAILRVLRSAGGVVAGRARPFAQVRRAVIDSPMSLESGTKSTSTSPMVR